MLRRTVVLFCLVIASSGCSQGGPQIAPVTGHVTLNGQPLANADVEYQPNDGQRGSTGRTDSAGRYSLMFKRGQPGAMVGPHTVHISISSEVVRNPPQIAARFNTQSELHEEVKSGDNEFDFDVTTEKNSAKN
jgi:hypothetical protein